MQARPRILLSAWKRKLKGIAMFSDLPRPSLLAAAALLAWSFGAGCDRVNEAAPSNEPASYLFCFWNVENLFDDHEDHHVNRADQEFDRWFGHDHEALRLKLDHLSKALLTLNGGRGPDIIALAEVESERAAELLRDRLNERLHDPSLDYKTVLFKEVNGGRHISPTIITRLPVARDRTRLHGSRLRILEGHIVVGGHDLVVIASHWTARVTDEQGHSREKYANQIYGVFKGMYRSNPRVDLLIAGDFNDPPEAASVTEHLHASGDRRAVSSSVAEPLLLDLFLGKEPDRFGTHYFHRQWFIFDQIVVSPGMLDNQGWSCDPDSVQTIRSLARPGDPQHHPWRFGNEHDRHRERGFSDHFPVAVRLSVQ
jgi:endonuclease/exonuclease/phosphatase family metal-dependent hydrolase